MDAKGVGTQNARNDSGLTTALRRAVRGVGGRALAAVLLVAILTAVVVALLTTRLVATRYQASARVELYSIVGSHATYDVSSIAADFTAAYMDVGKKAGIDANPYEPAPTLGAQHPSDSSVVNITYAATDRQSSRSGLLAAARAAAMAVAKQESERTGVALTAASTALDDIVTGVSGVIADRPSGARYAELARTNVIQQVSQQYAAALVADATAKAATQSVGTLIDSMRVTTDKLSNTSAQIRVIGVAAVSAFAMACIVLLVLHRRHSRAEAEGDDDALSDS